MKKTYIIPSALAVSIGSVRPISASLVLGDETTTTEDTDGGWVKEDNSNIRDVNLWDEEW